ncbi:hypothetical protein INR49_017015 [Caranx melampygus]|nr:hypothetical protein INR49_017015 [Caranx melampygus]
MKHKHNAGMDFPHVAASFQEQDSKNWTRTLESVCEVVHNIAPLINAALDWVTGYKQKEIVVLLLRFIPLLFLNPPSLPYMGHSGQCTVETR